MTCFASVTSRSSLCSSLTMNIVSNLDKMVGMKSMFSSALESSHRPKMELAAARTEHLELRVVVIPALAMEMVCCQLHLWPVGRLQSRGEHRLHADHLVQVRYR